MLIFAGSLFAQKKAKNFPVTYSPKDRITIENEAAVTTPIPQKEHVFSKLLVPHSIGSSMNAYGMYVSGINPIYYSPAVNAIAFVHRAAAGTVTPDESGEMGLDYSLDGGLTWVSDVHISPTMSTSSTEGRYPQAVIYAPTENIDDARFVTTGPSHRFYGDGSDPWGKIHHLDGNFSETPTVNEVYTNYYTSDVDNTPSRLVDDADGNVWFVVSNIYNEDQLHVQSNTKFKIIKGAYSDDDDSFSWNEVAMIETDDVMIVEGSKCTYDWNIATHPTDANKLYFVILTILDGDTYTDQAHPHVWESTDGGDTWNLISTFTMDDYFKGVFNDSGIPIFDETVGCIPHFVSADPVVDANGTLHMFCHVGPGHATFGSYSGADWWLQEDGTQAIFQHYYDVTLDIENNTWGIQHIAPKICKVEYESWGAIEFRIHTQISKNADASKLLFTWDETTTSSDSTHNAPNFVSAGYKVSTDTYYEKEEITPSGSGADALCFFAQASPYLIEKDGGNLEIPFVICPNVDPAATGTPDLEPIYYMYVAGGEFEWLNPMLSTGIKNESTAIIDPVLVYPNPVADILYIGTNANVSLCDITGKELLVIENNNEKKEIQMSDYPAGTYIVKAYTNGGIITKKVINIK